MKLRNYTPHPVTIGDTTYPSEGIARIEEDRREVMMSGGITYASIRNGDITGMPEDIEDGDFIVVSRPVSMAIGLPHVVCPDNFIRDGEGKILRADGVAWFPNFD